MALIATHLGVVDENQINEMSYIFFEDVLEQLGHKLNFDAIVNYAGNSFVEKSWDMIVDSNPMLIGDGKQMSRRQKNDMIAFFGNARWLNPGAKTFRDRPRKETGKGK